MHRAEGWGVDDYGLDGCHVQDVRRWPAVSIEGMALRLTMLRADIAASAARTRTLRVSARKMGGRVGMEMLQRESDSMKQRARYLALAVLTGRECRDVDPGAVGKAAAWRDDVGSVLHAAAMIVQSITGSGGSSKRAALVAQHWALRGNYAVGSISDHAGELVRQLDREKLVRLVDSGRELVQVTDLRANDARAGLARALAALAAHDAKYPLTEPQPAATVDPH